MKIDFKKLINALFLIGTFCVILVVAFGNTEMTDAVNALLTLDGKWLMVAILGLIAYVFFDALSLHYFLRKQGYPIRVPFSLYVALIGFYYSNIIPSAGGGQPMQIYYLSKRSVPVGVSTSLVCIRLFCMQFMVVLTGLILWLNNREAMAALPELEKVKWLIIIGGSINFAAVPLLLLATFYRPPVQALAHFIIWLGTKIRIIKNREDALQRVNDTLDMYHVSIRSVGKAPVQLIGQMLLLGLSMLGLMSVPVSLYFAFGLSATPWVQILTVSYFLFWSSSYIPLPGAQEGGFLVFFNGIFTAGTVGLGLLVSRFLTFYSFLLIGPLLTLLWNFVSMRKPKAKPAPMEVLSGAKKIDPEAPKPQEP